MCTATTKNTRRFVRFAIDVNAKPYAVTKLDRLLAAALSFGGLLVMDTTTCSFSLAFLASRTTRFKLDQMLKPTIELHVSCLVFTCRHMNVRRLTCTHAHTHTYIHTRARARVRAHIHTHAHTPRAYRNTQIHRHIQPGACCVCNPQ